MLSTAEEVAKADGVDDDERELKNTLSKPGTTSTDSRDIGSGAPVSEYRTDRTQPWMPSERP